MGQQPYFPGGNNDDPFMRDKILFPRSDPAAAMETALRNQGINTYGSSKATMMKQAAKGLAQSWLQRQAMTGTPQMDNEFQDFGSYLQGAIGSGSIFSTLAQSARDLPNVAEALKNFRGATDADRLQNPYMSELFQAMNGQDESGSGVPGALAAYLGPLMGTRNMISGYQDVLDAAQQSNTMNRANADPNYDVFSYLLGRHPQSRPFGPQQPLP
jgi:hypothetical protein